MASLSINSLKKIRREALSDLMEYSPSRALRYLTHE